RRMEVIDFERHPADPSAIEISTCGESGGGQATRYFEISLDPPHPRVIALPDKPVGEKPVPAVKFPYRVSRSDPEYFQMIPNGPACLCSFRLAIDWSSGDQSGQLILDRGFGPIVIDTQLDIPSHHWQSDGVMSPSL